MNFLFYIFERTPPVFFNFWHIDFFILHVSVTYFCVNVVRWELCFPESSSMYEAKIELIQRYLHDALKTEVEP